MNTTQEQLAAANAALHAWRIGAELRMAAATTAAAASRLARAAGK